MPQTAKGHTILNAMKQEYGAKKGEQVFYASRNAGTISGVDSPSVGSPAGAQTPNTHFGGFSAYGGDLITDAEPKK